MPSSQLNLIERTSIKCGYGDFHKLTPVQQFVVYKLTLEEMFDILGKNPVTLPLKQLQEINQDLLNMETGFYVLHNNSVITELKMNVAIKILVGAESHMQTAISAYRKKGTAEATEAFFMPLRLSRGKINELIQFLRVK